MLYSPTSDESVYKTVTLYFYADGLLWTFVGGQGTWSLDLTTGGIGMLTFEFQAQFGAYSATAMPTGWNTTVLPTPPRFVGGKLQLNRTRAQANKLTVQAGVKLVLPDDPEASEGYGPAEPESRDSGGSIDPLMNTTTSVALFNAFRSGTPMSLTAVIGSTAGNRFCVTGPASKATGFTPGARDGLGQNAITFALDGADAAVFLAQF